MDRIVVDVEIAKPIEECSRGWDSTDEMGVSCACVWEYQTWRLRVYGPDDVGGLQARLLRADEIISFNGWRFDFPVIWSVSKANWQRGEEPARFWALKAALRPRSNDLLERIWRAVGLDPDSFQRETHGGWSLDNIAKGTLGVGKIGYGGDAPKWFRVGQWARVANYCADDVALTRDLSDFIDRYGYVISANSEQVVKIPQR